MKRFKTKKSKEEIYKYKAFENELLFRKIDNQVRDKVRIQVWWEVRNCVFSTSSKIIVEIFVSIKESFSTNNLRNYFSI
jgi:hypothetical protein